MLQRFNKIGGRCKVVYMNFTALFSADYVPNQSELATHSARDRAGDNRSNTERFGEFANVRFAGSGL